VQVIELDKEALRAQVHRAFDHVPIPTRIEDMLLPRYRNGEDAYEMAAAFAGRPWAEIPIRELFYHREMLATLSAVAYRAYLPAYLIASMASEDWFDKYNADIHFYLVMGLKVWPHQIEEYASDTPERLSLLDPAQRAAVASILRYLETRWRMKEAGEVLREW
jgi:hypothetical protein